jgi:GNAT superfamily N-acetyltransferase
MGNRRDEPDGSAAPVYAVEPLAAQHDRAAFGCGNADLDRYLRDFAGQDERRDVTRAFVLVEVAAPTAILGYYTLSAAQILLDDLPEAVRKRLPRRESVPAILLGRLAVDLRARGRGLGRILLIEAIERVLDVRRQLGVWAIIVDAIDEPAASFYEHHGFKRLPNQPSRLYLPLKDAAAIFGRSGR